MSDIPSNRTSVDAKVRHDADQLLPLVYVELRQLAAARMAAERPDHTLDATALVHEAYLRLGGETSFASKSLGSSEHRSTRCNLSPCCH
jgi:hypothetical protein